MSFRPQRKGIKKKYLIPRITQVIVLEICLALFLFALDEPTKLFSFFMSKQREFFSKNREYTHTQGRDHLTMVILTILTMDPQINTKKFLKIEKNFIDMFFYL
jgi:hypothetical protein